MKRFFILASAAIVALASCAKTQVVYKDGPQEIAFKQITGAMTKATSLATTISLGVTAHDDEGGVYFSNLPFGHNGTAWANNTAFWPYEGALTFTVYAPAGTASYNTNTEILTIEGVEAGENVYYGTSRVRASKPAKVDGVTPAINLTLKHISAHITVNVNLGTAYELTGLTLKAPTTKGNVAVEYTLGAAVKTIEKTTNTDVTLTSGSAVYVLPGEQTSIVVAFKQKAEPYQTYSKEIELEEEATWAANTKYVYNIGITAPEAITFNAEVSGWDEAEAVGPSLN